MSNVRQNITHFLHERHILIPSDNGHNYICNGCRLPGKGARYRCNFCGFDLHFLCAECPSQIPLSDHRMVLYAHPTTSAGGATLRSCDGCKQMVEGMFYHLEGGNYDLHPICLIRQLQQAPVAPDRAIAQERPPPHQGGFLDGFLAAFQDFFDVFDVLSIFGIDISTLTNAFNV